MQLSPRAKWLGVAVAAALGVALVARSGSCQRPANDATFTTSSLDEPSPAPTPDGLLADVYITTPNASWAKLQRGIGGAVGILPASAGGILCTIAGLDPFIASELDGTLPAFAVIATSAATGPGAPAAAGASEGRDVAAAQPEIGWAIAMKLTDLRKARGVLVDGDTARYGSRDAGGMTELVAKGNGASPPVAVAFSPNGYLLVARRSADLARLAPYVTRTLPRRALPSEGAVVFDVPQAAIGSVVRPKLEELWAGARAFLLASDDRMRRDHAGRPPDFGDPKAIVAAADGWVTRRIGVVGDLERLRVTLDLAEDGITVASTMKPATGGGPATQWTQAMKVGDVAALAGLPVTSAAALMMRDGEEERAAQAGEIEKVVTASLGARLAEPDARKLHDVVADVTKARGEVVASSLVWDEPQGFFLRAPVRDGDAASQAIRGAIELAKVAPFKEIFRVKDIASSSEDVPGVGKAQLATIARTRAKDAKDPRPPRPRSDRDGGVAGADAGAGARAAGADGSGAELAIAWRVDGSTLTATSASSTQDTFATLRSAVHPERTLGDEPSIARTLAALGTTTSALLLVQPLRFDPKRADLPAAPLVIALGRKDADATLRVDVANGLLRELARWQMGL